MEHSTSESVTAQQAGINKGFLLSFIMVVGLGAVNFGYSIGVFNSMQKDFQGVFDIHLQSDRDFWVPVITTLCSLGAAIGSLTSGPLMKIGKKNCIHLCNAVVIVGATLTLVKNLPTVAVGRFLYGLAAGAFSVFVPSFINEITPTELKGPFGSATQILITLGIFIANVLGIPMPDCLIDIATNHCPGKDPRERPYTPGTFINDDYWRILFGLPIAFAVLQSALLFTVFNYETPKFLKQNGRKAELAQIMGKIYAPDQVQARIDSIVVSTGGADSSPSYSETLTSPKYRSATLIGCTLSMLQQLSGINIVMFYSSNIMGSSGLPPNQITALVGFVNCVSVFPTIYLFARFGRKVLLWTLSLAIAGSLVGLGVSLLIDAQSQINGLGQVALCQTLSVVFLLLFIMFFEFSLGPLLWVYLSEVMTEKGLSLGVGVNQIITVLIAYFTNSLISGFGGSRYGDAIDQELGTARLFLTCGGITFVCAVFCFLVVKETKGLTDKEIQNLFSKDPENVTLQKQSYLLADIVEK